MQCSHLLSAVSPFRSRSLVGEAEYLVQNTFDPITKSITKRVGHLLNRGRANGRTSATVERSRCRSNVGMSLAFHLKHMSIGQSKHGRLMHVMISLQVRR